MLNQMKRWIAAGVAFLAVMVVAGGGVSVSQSTGQQLGHPLIGVAGFGLVITLLDYMYTRQADQRWAAIRQGGDLDE